MLDLLSPLANLSSPPIPLTKNEISPIIHTSEDYLCPAVSAFVGGGVPPWSLSVANVTSAPAEDLLLVLSTDSWKTKIRIFEPTTLPGGSILIFVVRDSTGAQAATQAYINARSVWCTDLAAERAQKQLYEDSKRQIRLFLKRLGLGVVGIICWIYFGQEMFFRLVTALYTLVVTAIRVLGKLGSTTQPADEETATPGPTSQNPTPDTRTAERAPLLTRASSAPGSLSLPVLPPSYTEGGPAPTYQALRSEARLCVARLPAYILGRP